MRPQVVGPHELAGNTGELLGRAQAESRILTRDGWRCVYLPAASLAGPDHVVQQRLAALLEKEGMSVRVPKSGQPRGQGYSSSSARWESREERLPHRNRDQQEGLRSSRAQWGDARRQSTAMTQDHEGTVSMFVAGALTLDAGLPGRDGLVAA